jgi:hypothetical protein
MTTAKSVLQRHLKYYNLLRDDGMSYGDDVEQLIIRMCYPYCS